MARDRHDDDRRSRLTASGTALAIGAAAVGAFGIATRYLEFVVLAFAGLALLVMAALVPRLTSVIELTRVEMPHMVQRGSFINVRIRATSDGIVPSVRVVDQLAGTFVPIDLPQITATVPADMSYRIQALRRGVHQVGPILEQRSDPFELVTRTSRHDVLDELYVYPKLHPLRISSDGALQRQRANQRPLLGDDPLADFRTLREYQAGDDPRLVHWASSARVGNLVVRDHFELRRALRLVVLETLDSTITANLFEEAVEIAASIAADAIKQNIMVVTRTRDARNPGRTEPLGSQAQVIELFTRVNRSSSASTIGVGQIRAAGQAADQVFLIAGPSSPLIAAFGANPWVRQRLVVVRMSARKSELRPSGVRSIDVGSAEELVARWEQGAVV